MVAVADACSCVEGRCHHAREPIDRLPGSVIDPLPFTAIWGVFGRDADRVFDLAAEVGAPYMRMGFNRSG